MTKTVKELRKLKSGNTDAQAQLTSSAEKPTEANIQSEVSPSFKFLLLTTALAVGGLPTQMPAASISQLFPNDFAPESSEVVPAISSETEVFHCTYLGKQAVVSFEDIFDPAIPQEMYEKMAQKLTQKLTEIIIQEQYFNSSPWDPRTDYEGVLHIYAKEYMMEVWQMLDADDFELIGLPIIQDTTQYPKTEELKSVALDKPNHEKTEEHKSLVSDKLNHEKTKERKSVVSAKPNHKKAKEHKSVGSAKPNHKKTIQHMPSGNYRRLSLIGAAAEFGKVIPANYDALREKTQIALDEIGKNSSSYQNAVEQVDLFCNNLIVQLQNIVKEDAAVYNLVSLRGSQLMSLLIKEALQAQNKETGVKLAIIPIDVNTLMAIAQTLSSIWQLVRDIRKDGKTSTRKPLSKTTPKVIKEVAQLKGDNISLSPRILDSFTIHLLSLEVEFCKMIEESTNNKVSLTQVEKKYRTRICKALKVLKKLNSNKLPDQPKFFELWSEFQCGTKRRLKVSSHG